MRRERRPEQGGRSHRAAVAAALLLCACSYNRLIQPGDLPGPGEVIVVGRALMNPVLKPPDDAPMYDAFNTGYFSQMGLFFFIRPDDDITQENVLETIRGTEEYLGVPWERPFAARLPAKTFYLRVMRLYRGTERGSSWGRPTATMYHLHCIGSKKVELKPGDRFVYIGTFACDHENERPIAIAVHDELEALRPSLPGLIGNQEVTKRLAIDLDAPQPPPATAAPAPVADPKAKPKPPAKPAKR